MVASSESGNTRGWLTWVEISESAYVQNLKFFRKRIGTGVELAVVVKANAYGHGWQQIAHLAARHGADSFCVHSLDEALKLRSAGFQQDVLIMSHVPFARLEEAIRGKFRLVIFNQEDLVAVDAASRRLGIPVRIHLKLETGTYRQGIDADHLPGFLDALQQMSFVQLEGVYTHFANIEDTTNHDYAWLQLTRFQEMLQTIRERGVHPLKKHTACSAAILLFPETHFDMVRLGISQYGLWPSRETFVSYKIRFTENGEDVLQPVLTWKTRVVQIKDVPAESTIGYGRTYQTTRPTRIAVLPVGYSDGYDRRLSNQSYVLIRGKRAPVRGRICMNLTMVDVTDIPGVQLEDEVVLIGRQGNEQIRADDLAGMIGTIHYEVVTRINWDIPRIVVP
ncbi:MAG: alanine racemase [Calditrichaeota bacterium]|nr:alanine racemase [Calditrichota bacterium]